MIRSPVFFKISVGLLLVIVAVVITYSLWLICGYQIPYGQIAQGDTEARVTQLLGKPNRIMMVHQPVTENWKDSSGFAISGRAVEKKFYYEVPVFFGDEYVVGFDSAGRAVFKIRLTSP